MKTASLLILSLLIRFSIFAQSGEKHVAISSHYQTIREDSLLPPVPPPNLYLKANILTLLEPDMAVTLAIEYRKNNEQAYQLEAGYIFLDGLADQEDLKHSYGFRLKPEWRFYAPGSRAKRTHYVNYWAVEGIIKAVYDKFHRFVGRSCSSEGCAYYQEMDYLSVRNVAGVGGKAGTEFYIDTGPRRMVLDVYAGLGIRYRWRNYSLPPDASHPESRGFLTVDRPTGFLPYISAGLKIGWRVK